MRNMTTSDFKESGETGETEEQRLSKSARKREAATLQELGVQLSALPDQEIKALGLPDSLFTALRDLRRLVGGAGADQLGRATKRAMESDPSQVEQIVRFVFSSLKAHEGEKVEAVISHMVLVVNRADVSKLVRIAVRARPSLAPTIANTAAMLVPEEADHISSAVASVVVTFS